MASQRRRWLRRKPHTPSPQPIGVWYLAIGICKVVNGARRWLNLGVSNFQAVEAVKLLYIVWLASYLKRYSEDVAITWMAMLKPVGVVGVLVVMLLLQPDFGSSVLLLGITTCMRLLGGAPIRRPNCFCYSLDAADHPPNLTRRRYATWNRAPAFSGKSRYHPLGSYEEPDNYPQELL